MFIEALILLLATAEAYPRGNEGADAVYLVGHALHRDLSMVKFTEKLADNSSEEYKEIETGLNAWCEGLFEAEPDLATHLAGCQLVRLVNDSGLSLSVFKIDLKDAGAETCLPVNFVLKVVAAVENGQQKEKFCMKWGVDLVYPEDQKVSYWNVEVKGKVVYSNGSDVPYDAGFGDPESEQFKNLQKSLVTWSAIAIGTPKVEHGSLLEASQEEDAVFGLIKVQLRTAEMSTIRHSRCITYRWARYVLDCLNYPLTTTEQRMTKNEFVDKEKTLEWIL